MRATAGDARRPAGDAPAGCPGVTNAFPAVTGARPGVTNAFPAVTGAPPSVTGPSSDGISLMPGSVRPFMRLLPPRTAPPRGGRERPRPPR
ncbi:MAG: hypothetical protein U0324_32765 [Polyangiales bacterium]